MVIRSPGRDTERPGAVNRECAAEMAFQPDTIAGIGNLRLGATRDNQPAFTLERRMPLRTIAYSGNRIPDVDHGLPL